MGQKSSQITIANKGGWIPPTTLYTVLSFCFFIIRVCRDDDEEREKTYRRTWGVVSRHRNSSSDDAISLTCRSNCFSFFLIILMTSSLCFIIFQYMKWFSSKFHLIPPLNLSALLTEGGGGDKRQ